MATWRPFFVQHSMKRSLILYKSERNCNFVIFRKEGLTLCATGSPVNKVLIIRDYPEAHKS